MPMTCMIPVVKILPPKQFFFSDILPTLKDEVKWILFSCIKQVQCRLTDSGKGTAVPYML